jgi:hypothetical protein
LISITVESESGDKSQSRSFLLIDKDSIRYKGSYNEKLKGRIEWQSAFKTPQDTWENLIMLPKISTNGISDIFASKKVLKYE